MKSDSRVDNDDVSTQSQFTINDVLFGLASMLGKSFVNRSSGVAATVAGYDFIDAKRLNRRLARSAGLKVLPAGKRVRLPVVILNTDRGRRLVVTVGSLKQRWQPSG